MAYKIEWDIRAYKELKKITSKDAVSILNSISKLNKDPVGAGKPLKGKFKGKRRLRVGDYRVLYWINENEKTVYVISVGHRKEIHT